VLADNLWILALLAQDDDAASRLAEESLAESSAVGYARGIALATLTLGRVRFHQGDHPVARELLERSLALFGPTSTPVGRLYALVYLCWASLVEGDLVRARAMGWQALSIGRDGLVGPGRQALPIEAVAQVAAAAGQSERALRLAGAAHALRERFAVRVAPIEIAQLEAYLQPARQGLGVSESESAFAAGRLLKAEQAIDEAQSVEILT
jgi:hypothetical protein